MAVTAYWYGKGIENLFKNTIDADSHTFKCMLTTNSYTPDVNVHDQKADVTNEVTGTGYTAGGKALTSVAVSLDVASSEVRIDAADVEWTSSTITARRAVVYDDTAAGDELLMYVDFGQDLASTNGTFAIQWDSTGLCKIAL